jgi:serine phosphatase RsbU (regulator of sigma subunit)
MGAGDSALASAERVAAKPAISQRPGDGEDAPLASAVPLRGRRWGPSRVAVLALLAGLAVTAALTVISLVLYDRNETRLLDLRARELGLVLSATVPGIQTPIASGAALADATGGNVQKFRAFIAPEVGTGRPFSSVSLWPVGGGAAAPLTVVGTAPALPAQQARAILAPGAQKGKLKVIAHLQAAQPSIGYEFSTPGVKRAFAIYAETPLPKSRRSKLETNSAFSDLNYAVYLGRLRTTRNLLVTSLKRLPITSRKASTTVAFGDSRLSLVVTPRGSLGGTFFESLPWIVAVSGLLISLAAAMITDRLARGRQRAEQLAGNLDLVAAENERMYTEQRNIAQTLQHALLPDALPEVSGLRVSARYVPATSGVEVGGDWYDVVAAGEHRVLLVIGDVSGHGLRAATTMASLRHATLAYAAHDPRPAAVLARLSDYVNSGPHDYFATVLCAMIDVDGHRLTLASAGHLPPLLIDGDDGNFVEMEVNVPIGVERDAPYHEATVVVPPNATLVAFTDGLVERRDEVVDTGLARLRDAATARRLPLDDLIERLPDDLAFANHHDDTAIVGVQWRT